MSGNNDPVYVRYDFIEGYTLQASVFDIEGRKVWIPKSQIIDQDVKEKIVAVPRWLAREKKLKLIYSKA